MSFLGATLASGLAGLSSLVFGFVSSVIVARILGADENGLVAYAVWLATTLAVVADLGIPHTLLRYMDGAREDEGGPRALAGRLLKPYLGSIAVIMVAFVAWGLLAHGRERPDAAMVWAMSAALLLFFALTAFSIGASRGSHAFGESARDTLVGCLLQVPLVFLGALWFGVPGALAGYVVRYVPQGLRLIRYVDLRRPATPLAPAVRTFARNTWLSNLAGLLVWTRLEFLFIAYWFSAHELGYYAVAMSLASLAVQLPSQLSAALVPFFGRHHDQHDQAALDRLYKRMTQAMAMLILPICLGGAAVAPQMIPLLFGEEFLPAVPTAEVLIGFAALTALATVPTSLISSRERSDVLVWATPLIAIVMIGLLSIAVPWGGGLGAALARSAAHGLWLVALCVFIRRSFGIGLPLGALARILAAAILCALTARVIVDAVPGLLGLAAGVAAGAVIYAAALRTLRVIPPEDMVLLEAALRQVLPGGLQTVSLRLLALIGPLATERPR